jgi:hypothetical protein
MTSYKLKCILIWFERNKKIIETVIIIIYENSFQKSKFRRIWEFLNILSPKRKLNGYKLNRAKKGSCYCR